MKKVQQFSLIQLLDLLSRRGTLKGDDVAKRNQLGQALNAIECLPDDGGYVNLTSDEQVMLLRRLNDTEPTKPIIVQGGEQTLNAPNALPNAQTERSESSADPIRTALLAKVDAHYDLMEQDYIAQVQAHSEARAALILQKAGLALAPGK